MKPSKKQTSQELKKKELKSAPKIGSYFKTVPKTFVNKVKRTTSNECQTKAIYIDALKQKLKELAAEAGANGGKAEEGAANGGETEEGGANEGETEEGGAIGGKGDEQEVYPNAVECTGCIQKGVEYEKLEIKHKALEKRYVKLTIRFSEQELKYNDLLQTKTRTNEPDANDTLASNGDVFSPFEIKSLQRISLEKKYDSTFILQGLQYAYKNNLSILPFKCLKGKPEVIQISDEGEVESIAGKDPLSPIKVQRLKELFIQRVSKCDSVSFGERVKDANINRLISSGVKNIAKKQ